MAREGHDQRGGISLRTLVIASVASAVAAYVVSRVWGAGTLFGAAATPVIVALVSEGLRRPAEKLPPIAAAVRPRPGAPAPGAPGDTALTVDPPADEPPGSFAGPRRVYRTSNRRHWRLALLTGLAAFAIVAGIYTVTDLAAGEPVTGGGRSSSLFDFSGSPRRDASTTPATTTETTETTQTQTVTVPAATPTVTVTTPTATATQTTTSPPAQAAPPAATQTTTTPAPPATTVPAG